MRTSLAVLALAAALPAQQLVADPFFQGASRSGPEVWTIAHPKTRIYSWGPLVMDATDRDGWPWEKLGLQQTIRAPVAGWYLLSVSARCSKPSIASMPVEAEVYDATKSLCSAWAPCNEYSTGPIDFGSTVVELEANKDYVVKCRVHTSPATIVPPFESTIYACTLEKIDLPVGYWWRRKVGNYFAVDMAAAQLPGTDLTIGMVAFGSCEPLKVPGLHGLWQLDVTAPGGLLFIRLLPNWGWGVPFNCPPLYGQLLAIDFDANRWSIGSLTVLR